MLSHGWAYATLGYTDIQPDNLQGLTSGVIGLSFEPGQTERKPNEWGSISAWAWGLSRAVDYLVTDRAFDGTKISVTGVSRLGKTVLWAGAQDERIAAVFSVVPGAMGAALIRRDWGETLDDMAQNFPWQFAGNLQQWVGRWNDLPVDQHMPIALIAPRLLYVNGGLTDQWSDPRGQFLALLAAGPVYRLLGKTDLGEPTRVPTLTGMGWACAPAGASHASTYFSVRSRNAAIRRYAMIWLETLRMPCPSSGKRRYSTSPPCSRIARTN